MISIVAVLSLAFAAAWSAGDTQFKLDDNFVTNILNKKGEQYKLYAKHTEAVRLPRRAVKDTLLGLDIVRGDGQSIDEDDLKEYYWHSDVGFAVERFITMINNDEKDRKIDAEDLKDDLAKKEYKVALSECEFLKSPGLRQSCYADQLLTYVLLAVGDKDTQEFVDHLSGETGKQKQSIPKEKITGIKIDGKEYTPEELEQTAEELGANSDNVVTYEELDDYISQESILDDFRRCRTLKDEKYPDFEDKCLTEELVEYANDDLTDLDIAVFFRYLDQDENDIISERELKNLPGVETKVNHRDVLELLDMDGPDDEDVDFSEFRAYLRSPTVLIQLERACTEKEKKQEDEIECIIKEFTKLALDLHYPIWLTVPDLDQEITFEIFDFNNDGILKEEELKGNFFKEKEELAVTRFIEETNSDNNKDIDLEEFNEYVDIPHMVYGTADCLLESRKGGGKLRQDCFTDETIDIVDNIKYLPKSAFQSWFKSFDKNNNGHIDIGDTIADLIDEEKKELFLEELGQGSDIVTEFEFTWYAKQQELADRYEEEAGIKALKEDLTDVITELNKELLNYINNDFTELDTVQLFKRLDVDDNGELTEEDFPEEIQTQMKTLLEHIDSQHSGGDADKTVNFLEFWLWLNSPSGHDKAVKKIKDKFEDECIKTNDKQSDEIKCLVKKFQASSPA